ncbi:uncharacterized protein LOC115105144 [Oncorhynchus nerka]|uniref:uncharacterized protein LOC115105144 n=1 Tax=Oncorhynchus nerka TaxID=8023 RepID=UPI00112FD39B|nr:uncharacterized protein LOC115105144 [Oncorhynchus nerka]
MYRSHVSPYGQGSMERHHHHVVLHGVCIALAMLSQVASETFHVLASGTNSGGLFMTTSDNVSESFPLEVTMDCWADNTWFMLWLWSSAWLIHSLFTVFQRNVFGPVSCNPEIHPPSFYLIWTMINVAKITWLFLWDRHDLLPSLFFKWVMPIHSFQMLYVSYRNLHNHRTWLAINNPKEPWWTRYLTQNGLAVFGWWTLLEALVSLGVVLRYQAGLPDPLVSSMVLTLLLLGMLIWFVFESFIFSKYIRYTFTVYPVLIVGLGAMFTRSYRVHDLAPNTVYCGFLMLAATILNCIRLIAACFYPDDTSSYLTKEPNRKPDFCKTVCQPMGKDSTMASQTAFVNPVFCNNLDN